ncbi:hypothetical protein [Spirosoma fluviale]|uniref:Uncharacterized protein n=1 Tax=Spirosoma fluviale TaxID=1597977 RepID=A0A286GRU4_9BACT|nr:hypothetical protein [Spirosoma fluviale]SOD97779.1 hypothetical protein SAMN06269250_5918 [Spirosoma fluviale]
MILKVLLPLILIGLLASGCRSKQATKSKIRQFRTLDYVDVGQRLPHVRTPYVIELANQAKHLVFVGCNHTRDSTDRQVRILQKLFAQLKPQIAFNEGGQVKPSLHYPSLMKAAFEAGETGCMKYLSDQTNIPLLNGDTPDSLEFAVALKYYPRQELYLYYVMERIVVPYLTVANQEQPFEPYFNDVVRSFVSHHFPLSAGEQSLAYFKALYQQYMNRPFVLALTHDIEKFDYINGGDCHFCEVGRRSKMIRDSLLLIKLDQALDEHDRVMVSFGCGHALAVEPALHQLLAKKRKRLLLRH